MATDTNVTVQEGNLTADPEEIAGGSGCKFSIAVNEMFKPKDEDRYKEYVNYFEVTVWGAQSKPILSHLSKGSHVVVTGRLKQERWEDGDGKKRSMVKIVAGMVKFGPKASGSNSGSGSSGSDDFDAPADDDLDAHF